jgi:hypothetical protein
MNTRIVYERDGQIVSLLPMGKFTLEQIVVKRVPPEKSYWFVTEEESKAGNDIQEGWEIDYPNLNEGKRILTPFKIKVNRTKVLAALVGRLKGLIESKLTARIEEQGYKTKEDFILRGSDGEKAKVKELRNKWRATAIQMYQDYKDGVITKLDIQTWYNDLIDTE